MYLHQQHDHFHAIPHVFYSRYRFLCISISRFMESPKRGSRNNATPQLPILGFYTFILYSDRLRQVNVAMCTTRGKSNSPRSVRLCGQ